MSKTSHFPLVRSVGRVRQDYGANDNWLEPLITDRIDSESGLKDSWIDDTPGRELSHVLVDVVQFGRNSRRRWCPNISYDLLLS